MKLLSIDPGLARTGYAIFKVINNNYKLLEYDAILTDKNKIERLRIKEIFDRIKELIAENSIDVVALEKLFFSKNVKTAFQVGYTRGIILLASAQHGLDVYEYTPQQLKAAVTGYGKSDKNQVQKMVKKLLKLPDKYILDDTADAIALGLCHINSIKLAKLIKNNE